jgi:hypothetical protein
VITPAGTRTAEPASAGHDAVSWPEIVLLALLVMAASLVLVPAVRRRMLPALAGLPPAEGYVGRAGTPPAASVTAAAALREAPASTPEAAAPQAPAAEAPGQEAAAVPTPRPAPEPPQSTQPEPAASPVRGPHSQPEGPVVHRQPVAQPQPRARTTWLREHATQGTLVATVLAGGLVRILRRGRGR